MLTPRHFLLTAALAATGCLLQAQNIGINTTGASPHASAMLDVVSNNRGLLVPRMTAAQRIAIAAPATGLLVFQTNASAPIPANQFWYYDGTDWKPLFSDRVGWSIWGNGGTNAATNFLGTTDNIGLRIRTNNAPRFEFTTTGALQAIGNGTAAAPAYSWTTDPDIGLFRQGANMLGFSTNGIERFRIPNANQVHAAADGTAALPFYSWASDPDIGLFRQSANALGLSTAGVERMRLLADGRITINSATPNNSRLYILGTGNTAGVFSGLNNGAGFGLWGSNDNITGTGVAGRGQNTAGGTTYLVDGSGGAFSGRTNGLLAFFDSPGVGTGVVIQDNYNVQWDVGTYTGTYYKILGTGLVSTIVHDLENQRVVMVAPEAPEALFQDHGFGQLENGRAIIYLDPVLTKNILVDEDHPLAVLIQLEGACNGVYVTNKGATGFEVVEQMGGTSNAPFTWFITANRAGESVSGPAGTREVSYTGRFNPAPPIRERATLPQTD